MRSAVVDGGTEGENSVLDRLAATIADEPTRTAWWRDRGDFYEDQDTDEEIVGVQVGIPEPKRVADFFARYEAQHRMRLPHFYFELVTQQSEQLDAGIGHDGTITSVIFAATTMGLNDFFDFACAERICGSVDCATGAGLLHKTIGRSHELRILARRRRFRFSRALRCT
ncbi:MAG: hypothetical protein K0S65_6103, partial [Labilithrix sp.]|nr:hypothetical protein [Labilithrix sp.]